MRRLIQLSIAFYLTLLSTTASATLIDQGNGLIYDDALDITWLQDANYAKTTGFDNDGEMIWDIAMGWASGLEYAGFSDWRLPTTLQPDLTCGGQNEQGSHGVGCTGSEMGHLFNVSGISAASPGPFINLQTQNYWSSTELLSNTLGAWHFAFSGDGHQNSNLKDVDPFFAWAVHDGDIASVPEPSTLLLMATGLAGLGFASRKRKTA